MTITYYEVPLSPTPQTFNVTLGVVVYQFLVIYRNCVEGGWFLDIANSKGVPLVQGIPLVTGADLLAQYPQFNFGGVLAVYTDGVFTDTPTFTNLGVDSHLVFGAIT